MAKANLVFPDGTKVNIEGTPEEVALLLEKLSRQESNDSANSTTKKKNKKKRKKADTAGRGTTVKKLEGPTALITELIDEGYFKAKRTIADIQKKLEERGHIYAQTSISPQLTRLTRRRTIRRIKENKGWVYVK